MEHIKQHYNEKCGSMPNVMAALRNIGGALCSTPQSLLTPTTRVPCSNTAKTRNPLKFAGVPQSGKPISAISGPTSATLWGYCCLTSFFLIGDICLSREDTARQSCAIVLRWRIFSDFLRPVFSASHMQHISDLHSKFALRPHQ